MVAWNVYLHIQSLQSILFNTFFLLNFFAKCIFMLEPNPVAEELATLRNAALQGIEERAAHYAVTNLRRGDWKKSHRPIFAPT